MQLKQLKTLGAAVALTLTFTSATIAETQSTQPTATQETQSAAPVNMSQVSYIMGYGLGKLLAEEKLTVDYKAFNSGYSAGKIHKPDQAQATNKSYVIGYKIAGKFESDNVNIQLDRFTTGMKDSIAKKPSAISTKDAENAMQAFLHEKTLQYNAAVKANQKTSAEYLAKVEKQSGVKQLDKGLYYKVITAGKGEIPTATDTVTVNYEGSLPNGKVFDSSYNRGKPASFQVNKVIPGWTKALEKMPVGSTWELYISPELAYGTYAPSIIGPNQALTFKVSLIDIKKSA